MNSHTHSFTPSGSVTPSVTGASYTPKGSVTPSVTGASYTPKGSVSVTTNPTFTGSEVTSVTGGEWDFAIMQCQWLGGHGQIVFAGTNTTTTEEGESGNDSVSNSSVDNKRFFVRHSGHTHKVTAKGTISGGAYTFSGTAATITPTVTATFSGTAATITPTVTATFTGTAGTTGGTTVTGSYSGTRTTTENTGSATAVNKMPPYLVEYCWKRTA